jgi:hypothetical protein
MYGTDVEYINKIKVEKSGGWQVDRAMKFEI